MDLAAEFSKVSKMPQVAERAKKGFYLSSILLETDSFAAPRELTFVFFNPKIKDVFSVKQGNVSEISDPLVEAHYTEIDLKKAGDPEKLLKNMQEKALKSKFRESRVILAFRGGVWQGAVVTTGLQLLKASFSPKTGKITGFKIENLTRNPA